MIMPKKAIQILLILLPFLSQAQTNCIRSQALVTGEFLRYDYPTAYYVDDDTFDFPLLKIWKGQSGDRIWVVPTRFSEEKIVVQADRSLAPPDTFRFERFVKTTGKETVWQLTRFFGDIYQVWQIVETKYATARQHTTLLLPIEVRIFRGIYQGWPDDFMKDGAYKTNQEQVLKQIEKYRCKDLDAGKRRAGTK